MARSWRAWLCHSRIFPRFACPGREEQASLDEEKQRTSSRRAHQRTALPALALLLVWAAPAWTDTATPLGPDGGPVASVAVDPVVTTTALAASYNGGVFRTTDGGASWQLVAFATGLGGSKVAFAPSDPNIAYATGGSTLLRSADNGVTWAALAMGPPCFFAFNVDVHPSLPDTIYATNGSSQVCISSDGGNTWSAVTVGGSVQDVAIDPSFPNVLYAATNSGVYKSTDGGASWTLLSLSAYVNVVAVDPSTPDFVYAGTTMGLYQSADGGATWQWAGGVTLPAWSVRDIEINTANPQVRLGIFDPGAVYKSADGGVTWSQVSLAGATPVDLAFDPTDPATVYAGLWTGGTLWKTIDGGASWFAAEAGITGVDLEALAVSPAAPGLVFASDNTHVWKSADSGATWTQSLSVPSGFARALAADPSNPSVAYAAVDGQGIYKTTDGGATWTKTWSTTEAFGALAVNPFNPSEILAGAHGSTVGIYKSTDGGLTWAPSNSGLPSPAGVQALLYDVTTPGRVYAGLYAQGSGIYVSGDGGSTWVQVSSNGTVSLAHDTRIGAAGRVYAGGYGGLWWSDDWGSSWHASSGLPAGHYVESIAVDPVLPGIAYAGTTGAGLYRTVNGGISWQPYDPGLPSSLGIAELAADPFSNRHFYVATNGLSVFGVDVACGNGIIDAGEACDEGAANGSSSSCCTVECQVKPAGTVCRAAAGVCDLTETCTGTSGQCPADQKSTAVCRPAAGPCDLAEQCDGVTNDCPVDQLAPAGTVCRPAAGACDVPETCSGGSPSCPADQYVAAGTVCRAAAGVCDVEEVCPGTGPDCPADQKSTAVCRPAAGPCDLAEQCDGTSDQCPPDQFVTAGTVCRAAAGECDIAETCDGANAACPPDQLAPAGTPCGDPTASQCTNPDTCDGSGTCLPNHVADGTACEDGNACTAGDTCQSGVCASGVPTTCDDGSPCTVDTCDPTSGCVFLAQPDPTCRAAGQAAFQVVDKGNPNKRKLAWKWKKGDATPIEDFGAPDVDTDYHLCVYDSSASAYEVATELLVVPGSGWRQTRAGWVYKDPSAASDGVKILKLKAGAAGKAQIQLKAVGAATPTPAAVSPDRFFTQDPVVTVQMWNGSGMCWGVEFDSSIKNTGTAFKTKRKVIVR